MSLHIQNALECKGHKLGARCRKEVPCCSHWLEPFGLLSFDKFDPELSVEYAFQQDKGRCYRTQVFFVGALGQSCGDTGQWH